MLACLRALLPLRLQALYYLTRFFPAAVMTEAVAIFMSFAGGLNAVITPSTCCLILNLLEGAAGVDRAGSQNSYSYSRSATDRSTALCASSGQGRPASPTAWRGLMASPPPRDAAHVSAGSSHVPSSSVP